MIVFLLRMFGLISNTIARIFDVCVRFLRSLEEVFSSKEYIFFDFNPAPYLHTSVKETASGSATPLWLYDSDTRIFTQYDIEGSGRGGTMCRLPILSLEIIYKDKIEYDLTEFIDTIRVRSIGDDTKSAPSIPHILGAWGLQSGVILDSMRGFEIRLIDEIANTIEMPPFEYSDLYDILAGAVAGNVEEEVVAGTEEGASTTDAAAGAADLNGTEEAEAEVVAATAET